MSEKKDKVPITSIEKRPSDKQKASDKKSSSKPNSNERSGGSARSPSGQQQQKQSENSSRSRSKGSASKNVGNSNRDDSVEYGILVTAKEEFGFIRGFGRTEDLFFHYDEIDRKEDAVSGREVSFQARISPRNGREMAMRVRVLPNGSLLEKVSAALDSLPNIGSASLERGEIISIGEKSGVFYTSGRQYAVFDATKVDRDQVKKGAELACRVVRDPITGVIAAVLPFKPPREALEVGRIKQIPSEKANSFGKITMKGKDFIFESQNANRTTESLRVGDLVWFAIAPGNRANDVILCTPKGEEPFTQMIESNEKDALKSWLMEDEEDEKSPKRSCGAIVSIRDTFAFVKPERGADSLFLPASELCSSTPDFTWSSIKIGDFVTFEVKKVSNKESDVATRAFIAPGLTKQRWKRSKDILLQRNVQGKVANASGKSVRTVDYDALAVTPEAPELMNSLKSLKEGKSVDLSKQPVKARKLAVLYCKWIGNGLHVDEATGLVTKSANNEESSKASRQILPCQESPDGSEIAYDVGDIVAFDVYLDASTGKRFAILIPELPQTRPVELDKDEIEVGIISSLYPPVIVSSKRETKVKLNQSVGKPGDVVKFRAEIQRYGLLPVATDVSIVDIQDPNKIGLEPLAGEKTKRIQGYVLREMPKTLTSKSESLAAVLLQSSFTSGPRSGIIAVGRDDFVLETINKPNEVETDTKVPIDWRRETELLRVVRSCKVRESDEEPLHVFKGLNKAEQRSIEKEAKKQGLSIKAKDNTLALGNKKSVLVEWENKVGRKVRVAPFGEGRVIGLCERTSIGTFLQVGLWPEKTIDGSEKYGAVLHCVESTAVLFMASGEENKSAGDRPVELSEEQEQSEQILASLRAWVHQGILPPQAIKTLSDTRVVLPNIKAVLDACLEECLAFTQSSEGIVVDCSTKDKFLTDENISKLGFVGNFGFALDVNTQLFPVAGDLVEFTPCRSTASGILRAADVKLVKASAGRTIGTVEEMNSKGGWVRPPGKLAAEFFTIDVLGKNLNVGDLVDFVLSDKGDRATKVRLLESKPRPAATASLISAKDAAPAERPRINQELIANAPNASSGAAYVQAPGPDDTIGFTKEKWRSKRQVANLNAAAPEFTPSVPVVLLQNMLQPVSPIIQAVRETLPASKPTSDTPKIRANAPAFVPQSFAINKN